MTSAPIDNPTVALVVVTQPAVGPDLPEPGAELEPRAAQVNRGDLEERDRHLDRRVRRAARRVRLADQAVAGRAGLLAAWVVRRARARRRACGVAAVFPWVHLGIGDGGDLEVVAAVVAQQILVQLAMPLPAGTLECRRAVVARRQARCRIGNEAPALK